MSRSLSWIEADDLAQSLRDLTEAEPRPAAAPPPWAPLPGEASTLPPAAHPQAEARPVPVTRPAPVSRADAPNSSPPRAARLRSPASAIPGADALRAEPPAASWSRTVPSRSPALGAAAVKTQLPAPILEDPGAEAAVALSAPAAPSPGDETQVSLQAAPAHPSYPRGAGMVARLELFRAWMLQLGLGSFFVADEEGLPLLLQGTQSVHAVRAVAFERALRPLRALLGGAPPRALGVQLQDGRTIQTVWADTRIGRVAVGMAEPRPLPWPLSDRVRSAVFGAFEAEERA